ncbi:MAG: hypothetical protein Q9207_000719 [Kuettlingeria erythrocarpa]
MPPPAQLLQDTSWTKLGRPAASRQFQSLDYNPGRHYDYAKMIKGDKYRANPQLILFSTLQALQRHGSLRGLQHPSDKVWTRVKIDGDPALNACTMDQAPTDSPLVILNGNPTMINHL